MVSEFVSKGTSMTSGESAKSPTAEPTIVGQQFLRFHLLPDTTAVLPVYQMTEVLTIPVSQIVPIPHMPAWVMGVYNWRGEILWIVDLGHLLGLSPLYQQAINRSTYTAIVIHSTQQMSSRQRVSSQITGQKLLGLVVTQVEDMEWCDPQVIQSPLHSEVTPDMVPFLRGYWIKSNGEMLVVLDGESVLEGMPKSSV